MYKSLKILILVALLLAFTIVSPLWAKEKIGVIYPSLFITEELASFTQAIIYLEEKGKFDSLVVNGKPTLDSLTSLCRLLKKDRVKNIIIRDDIFNISNFYPSLSSSQLFFSLSPSLSLPKKKNIKRVVPTYLEMVKVFKNYAEKNNNPDIYLIMENLTKKDIDSIDKLFNTYKGKWKLFNPKEVLTSFGLNDKLSFENKYLFLYMTSYKRAGILIQLISKRTKNSHVVIFGNLLSPTFFDLLPNQGPEILIETDLDLKSYQKEYEKFRSSMDPKEFLSSIYDFARLKEIYKTILSGKKSTKKAYSIKIQGLRGL